MSTPPKERAKRRAAKLAARAKKRAEREGEAPGQPGPTYRREGPDQPAMVPREDHLHMPEWIATRSSMPWQGAPKPQEQIDLPEPERFRHTGKASEEWELTDERRRQLEADAERRLWTERVPRIYVTVAVIVGLLVAGVAFYGTYRRNQQARDEAVAEAVKREMDRRRARMEALRPGMQFRAESPDVRKLYEEHKWLFEEVARLNRTGEWDRLPALLENAIQVEGREIAGWVVLADLIKDLSSQLGAAKRDGLLSQLYDAALIRTDPVAAFHGVAASQFMEMGKVEKAIATLAKANRLPDATLGLRRDYLFALLVAGRTAEAVPVAKDMAKHTPKDVDLLLLLADLLHQVGEAPQAIELLEGAMARLPASPAIPSKRIDLLLKQNRAREALAAAEEAMDKFPKGVGFPVRKGMALLALGRAPEAYGLLSSLANDAVLKDNAAFWMSLGLAAQKQGSTAEAEIAYRRSIALAEKAGSPAGDARNNLVMLLLERPDGIAEAVRQAAEAVAEVPTNPDYLDTHGRALAREGKVAEAVEAFEKALRVAKGPRPDIQRQLEETRASLKKE